MILFQLSYSIVIVNNASLRRRKSTLLLRQHISARIKRAVFGCKMALLCQNVMLSVRKTTSAPTQKVDFGGEKCLCADAEICCWSDNVSLRRRNYILSEVQRISARTQQYDYL